MSVWKRIALVAAPLALGAPAAVAVDGVLEINQTCAAGAGCFAGDTAGLPVIVSAPGSYRLTSDLDTGADPITDGIHVLVDGVSIDLNGFEIKGPQSCTGSGATIVCAPSGPGAGIDAFARAQLSVRNGRISGLGSGIHAGDRAQVFNVILESNVNGVITGRRSDVSESAAHGNAFLGIGVGRGSVVERSIASGNGGTGIFAEDDSSVIGSASSSNGGAGISTGAGCVVRNNAASSNTSQGIVVGIGGLVSDNAVYQNGLAGIKASADAGVQRNTVSANTGFGLNLLTSSIAYRENTVNGNTGGTVTGGINLGDNSCNGTVTCP